MINAPIYVFDSIGCRFSILNNDFLVGQSLVGYNTLTHSHVGSYIPYLARNSQNWEIGVGYVVSEDSNIIVNRTKVVKSSNKNKLVDFGTNFKNSEFFIFANEFGFSSGFNNVIVKNSDFAADSVQAVYLVDAEKSNIQAQLPQAKNSENITIQFKLINSKNVLYIRDDKHTIIDNLSSSDTYATFVCDGERWYRLNPKKEIDFSSLSVSDDAFSILSDPAGSNLSFQYNNGGNFGSANFYYGANDTLLLGTDSENTAHAIIPVSGSSSTIFNSDQQQSNFIVHGSGVTDKNLFFDYRGRLGLNIPSGSTPSTILHIINTTCRDGIRIENRTSCHPTNITLFYKPSADLSANETVGLIRLSAKDTNGNQSDFVELESVAVSNTAGSNKGRFNLSVATSDVAGTGVKTIQTDPDVTIIGYSNNNNLEINRSGLSKLGYSGANISVNSSTVNVTGTSIVLNGPVNLGSNNLTTNGSVIANIVQANSLKIQGISEGSILSVNSSGNAVAGTDIRLPNIGSGYLLTTASGGSITGIYQLDDYFFTNGDILWNKYDSRDCSVALRQIIFADDDISSQEYSMGDQVEITIGETKYYRNIQEIEINNDIVVSLLVNQNITDSTIESGTIVSITKGGFLSISKSVEDGTESDGTSNILSVRPGTSTVFNSNRKEIDFEIYGVDPEPAFKVSANAGIVRVPSGIYHAFATLKTTCEPCDNYVPIVDTEVFEIVVNNIGKGLSSAHSSANFNYAATGIFSGMLTSVGTNGLSSYYGTYDQNGNAAEWVEDIVYSANNYTSTNPNQYVAGGSWKTEMHDDIASSGLRSIMQLTKNNGYEDVGFRVASLYNLTDSSNVADQNNLNLKFVNVENPQNFSDERLLYLYNYEANNDPDTDDQYYNIEIPNLGTVNRNYRIGTYEVTNDQYVKFLNSVATADDRSLYKAEMGSSDRGGITRVGDGVTTPYEYSVKTNMGDKPVVFVDYISALRFINWLHNGPSLDVISESNIDNYINYGAYEIGAGAINKNIYQKYWLPSIHQWHKAAYYEPVNIPTTQISSAVTIKRDQPHIVATGLDELGGPCTTLANLSVSGWLYVDHIIVGDGTIRSAKKFANCGLATVDTGAGGEGEGESGPPTVGDIFDNDNTNTGGGGTTCVGDECPDPSDPSVGGGTIGDSGSTDDDVCSGDNPPWWCDPESDGPTWF